MSKYRRGNILLVDFYERVHKGLISGRRPAVVISNDIGNKYGDTLRVVPLTTTTRKLPVHVLLEAKNYGMQLIRDSVALCEQSQVIHSNQVVLYKGNVTQIDMQKINEAILIEDGLSEYIKH